MCVCGEGGGGPNLGIPPYNIIAASENTRVHVWLIQKRLVDHSRPVYVKAVLAKKVLF